MISATPCTGRFLTSLPSAGNTSRGSPPSPPCATARDLSRRPPGSASGTAAPKGRRYPDVTKPAPPILVARHPPRRLYLLRLTPKHRYWAGGPPAALGSRLSGARAGAHALCGGLPPRERAEMSGAARTGDQPRGSLAPRIQVGSPGTRAPGPECPWCGAPLPRRSPGARQPAGSFRALQPAAAPP